MTAAELAAALSAGVDPARALKRLQAVGVESLQQVPLYLPTRFVDLRRPVQRYTELFPPSGDVVVVGRHAGDFETRWRPGRGGRSSPHGRGTLIDRDGMRLPFSLFGDARVFQRALAEAGDDEIALAGSLNPVGSQVWLTNPVVVDRALLGHVVPHYPGRSRVLAVTTARSLVTRLLPDAIPEAAAHLRGLAREIVSETRLRSLLRRPRGTLEDLLWCAHLPPSPEEGEAAWLSLERLAALLTVGDLKRLQQEHPPVRTVFLVGDWRDLATRVPFTLTSEQVAAADRLVTRFGGTATSATLINADVGMGKSIVYQLACAALIRAGGRAAVLLPNERLAIQAHADIARLFPELSPVLVTGRTGGHPNGSAVSPAASPAEARWLVGTTALLFRDVGHLDAVVVDEQHRFSVEQRRALAHGGTHVVELSATPIPRTQALLLYGELDVIRLTARHSPQDIDTRIVTRDGAGAMVEELRDIITGGGRLLIVCPRREDDEEETDGTLPSVARVAAKWERLFPGLVRSLHGESAAADADRVFDDLASGRARILVATTVVEVGLNIADLRGLVVVHAERFGISQLHQLRGRLAREGGRGHCYLYLPRPAGNDARLRLQAVASTSDGFELAEHDMRIRGIGDVSAAGERQHGGTGNLLLTRTVPMGIFIEMLEALNVAGDDGRRADAVS